MSSQSSSATGTYAIDIKFGRPNKTYRHGVSDLFSTYAVVFTDLCSFQETVSGTVSLITKNEIKHEGVYLEFDGKFSLISLGHQSDSPIFRLRRPSNIDEEYGIAGCFFRRCQGEFLFRLQIVFISTKLSSYQPIQLAGGWTEELAGPGKIPMGKTEFPFQFVLEPKPNRTLYETYHGVYVAIQVSF